MKEKALRDTQSRSIHEMGELKRARELRVDDFSVQQMRESHDTIQGLTSQIQELQERVNCIERFRRISRDRSELQWKKFSRSSQRAVIPSPRLMLSRDKRLPLDAWHLSESQGNVFW